MKRRSFSRTKIARTGAAVAVVCTFQWPVEQRHISRESPCTNSLIANIIIYHWSLKIAPYISFTLGRSTKCNCMRWMQTWTRNTSNRRQPTSEWSDRARIHLARHTSSTTTATAVQRRCSLSPHVTHNRLRSRLSQWSRDFSARAVRREGEAVVVFRRVEKFPDSSFASQNYI